MNDRNLSAMDPPPTETAERFIPCTTGIVYIVQRINKDKHNEYKVTIRIISMLFRDACGNLTEVRRHDFTTDALYYRHITKLKCQIGNVYSFMQKASQNQASVSAGDLKNTNRK